MDTAVNLGNLIMSLVTLFVMLFGSVYIYVNSKINNVEADIKDMKKDIHDLDKRISLVESKIEHLSEKIDTLISYFPKPQIAIHTIQPVPPENNI